MNRSKGLGLCPKTRVRGFTIIEVMIAVASSMLTVAAFISLFSIGTDMFNASVEQIETEQNLSHAAYYLKNVMSQAVKVSCCNGPGCGGGMAPAAIPFPVYNLVSTVNEPQNVAEGKIDCRNGAPGLWVAGQENAVGLFIRDIGKLNVLNQAASDYKSTAIYFSVPVNDTPSSLRGLNSGRLMIREGDPGGGAYHDLIVLNHLVNIGVVPGSVDAAPSGYLRSISYQITARFFSSGPGVVGRHYRPTGAAPTARYKDISTTVKIVFRNNRIGESFTNGITSERPLGQIYFFSFVAPHLGAM